MINRRVNSCIMLDISTAFHGTRFDYVKFHIFPETWFVSKNLRRDQKCNEIKNFTRCYWWIFYISNCTFMLRIIVEFMEDSHEEINLKHM
jgi:hypothetical protein